MLRCYGGVTAIVTVVSAGHMSIVTLCFECIGACCLLFYKYKSAEPRVPARLAAIFAPSN